MAVSGDGRFLALATPSGVRLFDLPQSTGATARLGVTGFPSLLAAGGSGTFTVTALDPGANTVPGYTGTVQLTSSDPAAVFLDPATGTPLTNNLYAFQPGDQGAKTFVAALSTGGAQSITATDVANGTVTGSQAGITVHTAPTTVVPVVNHRGLVYDATRGLLYITTADGNIQRYDVANQALLAPFHVGPTLNTADITSDGQFLYAADPFSGTTEGLVHKVNLDTGAVTNLTYSLRSFETGSYDIALGPDGKGYFTTSIVPGAGEGEPLQQIDLATDTVTSLRSMTPTTRISRSADRGLLFFTDNYSSAGALNPFDARTGAFLPAINFGGYLTNSLSAVNRNGTLLALVLPNSHVVSVFDRALHVVKSLPDADGGMAFDPVRDLLFVASPAAGQLIAYDTNTWVPQYTLPLGEAVITAVPFGNGVMAVNADGTKLFLATASGVRLYDLPQSTGVTSHFGVAGFPSLIAAGGTGSFTVTALDPINSLVPGYGGTVLLSSSDPTAVFLDPATGMLLNGNLYTFQPGDQGVKTFLAVLSTAGPQSITATDVNTGVAGSQAGIAVHALPVTDIPVANHRDLVYDATRGLLYITTADGNIQRYDVANQALLTPFHVSGALYGADITPDGQYLYVADASAGPTGGFLRKVNLDTGAVTSLAYPQNAGAYSVVVNANGKAFFTLVGVGSFPVYQIDLATDALSTRGGLVERGTWAARGADRSLDVFTQALSSGPAFTYDAAADALSATVGLNNYLTSTSVVNRDGSLIAVETGGNVRIYDRHLQLLQTLTGLTGGVAFDPVRDVLYAVNTSAGRIQAYDTGTWAQLFALPVGEPAAAATPYDNGMMTVSADGGLLFLATASEVPTRPFSG
jgi:hypothetical protein